MKIRLLTVNWLAITWFTRKFAQILLYKLKQKIVFSIKSKNTGREFAFVNKKCAYFHI